jgi:hypothetical protein
MLSVDQIAGKVNGQRRTEVPLGCTHLTMFIDAHQKALYWLIAGWEPDFTGYVVVWPIADAVRTGRRPTLPALSTLATA